MTYCLGICVADGIVFASDSRTNAGVDYASVYSKMHDFKPAPDRQFMLLSSGNLALSQEILNHLRRDLDHPGELGNLVGARYLFEAAEYVGQVSLQVQGNHRAALLSSGLSTDVTLIFGGQIAGEPHQLFLIYPQGNYVATSADTPFLQIGETKYGKPVLDRFA
ncbi:MAG: peptidase, partial [Porticoccaceae bacterium]